jgi:hypothetical protein
MGQVRNSATAQDLAFPQGKLAGQHKGASMAPPNAPSIAKVSVVGHRDQREWVNTFHVHKLAGAWTPADMSAVANIMVAWVNNYRAVWPINIFADVIEVRVLDPVHPFALDHSINPPLQGTEQGATEPGNVTSTISWRTGLAGRKHRGRDYVPGYATPDVTVDDRLGTAMVNLLATVAQLYITDITGLGGFEPVVFHKADNTWTPIISFVIDAILDSQRRRLPGRGR